jgi:hypothetical protein
MSDLILIPAIYEGSRDLKDRTKKLIFKDMAQIKSILKILAIIAAATIAFLLFKCYAIDIIAGIAAIIIAVGVYIILFEKPQQFKSFNDDIVKVKGNKAKILNSELKKLSKEDIETIKKLFDDNPNILESILHAMDRHTTEYYRNLDKN